MFCHECGEEFEIDGNSIATHIGDEETDGHDLDADHVPFSLEEDEEE